MLATFVSGIDDDGSGRLGRRIEIDAIVARRNEDRYSARGPEDPELHLFSCATPQHEALEAFLRMRELIAGGKAGPEEIAIAAASPADFDDHMMALSADTNIPIHFVHGIKAVANRDGQTAAALAETLIKGVSQERVQRLFALLHDASKAIVRS